MVQFLLSLTKTQTKIFLINLTANCSYVPHNLKTEDALRLALGHFNINSL